MPRDGSGVYSAASAAFVAGTTIASAAVNADIADIVTDLNTARPLTAGGTGGASQIAGWDGLTAKGTDIASASTINLTTATGPRIDITGTTTVTAVTLANNTTRIARATGIFILTASASLIVNKSTSVNYTTAVGDLMIFTAEGGVTSVTVIGGGVTFASVAQALAGTSTTLAVTPAGLYYPTGTLSGFLLSNSGADSIVIGVGSARSSDDTANMVLASSLTKSVATAWAVGTGNGGLDTGAVGNVDYFLWLIKRPDTNVVDALFSTSGTAPTMPTNYTLKALIGKFTRVSATNKYPRGYSRECDIADGQLRAYTATVSGLGTPAVISTFSSRNQDKLYVEGRTTAGTVAASEARVSIGLGTDGNVVSDSTKVPTIRQCGSWATDGTGSALPAVLIEQSVAYVTFGQGASGQAPLTKLNGNGFMTTGGALSFSVTIPIQGW